MNGILFFDKKQITHDNNLIFTIKFIVIVKQRNSRL